MCFNQILKWLFQLKNLDYQIIQERIIIFNPKSIYKMKGLNSKFKKVINLKIATKINKYK